MARKILFALLIGGAVCILQFTLSPMLSDSLQNSMSGSQRQSKFRYVSGGDSGEYASYVFHSSDERIFKTYNDCIGCPPYEDGDTQLFRQFMSARDAEEMFRGYSEPDSGWTIEEPKSNLEGGGFRKLAVRKNWLGNVLGVRILWINPTKRTYAYWFIQAPTVELAKEFEKSEAFRSAMKTIPPEPPGCETYGSNSANYDWCK